MWHIIILKYTPKRNEETWEFSKKVTQTWVEFAKGKNKRFNVLPYFEQGPLYIDPKNAWNYKQNFNNDPKCDLFDTVENQLNHQKFSD